MDQNSGGYNAVLEKKKELIRSEIEKLSEKELEQVYAEISNLSKQTSPEDMDELSEEQLENVIAGFPSDVCEEHFKKM